MDRLLEALARDLEQRGKINLDECFVDGSFSAAKKGGPESARPNGARGARSWQFSNLPPFLSSPKSIYEMTSRD